MGLKIFLLIIPFLIFILAYKDQRIKMNVKRIIPILSIYVLIVGLAYRLILFIPEVQNIFSDIKDPFYHKYILVLMISGFATLVIYPFAKILDNTNETKSIKKLESEYSYDNFDYYRELLDDLSPAMLAYIQNPKANINDQMVATILYLKEIKKGSELKQHEKYLEVLMKKNKKYHGETIHANFIEKLEADLKTSGYLEKNRTWKKFNTRFIRSLSITLMLTQIIFLILALSVTTISPLLIFSIFSIAACIISFMLCEGIMSRRRRLVRTEKALELKAKLDGLKKFLKDFTTINSKKIEEIKLYDEYILYAIIFNIEGDLNKESQELYNKFRVKNEYRRRINAVTVTIFAALTLIMIIMAYFSLISNNQELTESFFVFFVFYLLISAIIFRKY